MYVYISGPYSTGDQVENVRTAIKAADAVIRAGHIPFCPHLGHFHHLLCPHDYETWMRLDLAWVERCDAVIRLPGKSPGAEREVARAKELGIPVYYGMCEFMLEHHPTEKRLRPGFIATARRICEEYKDVLDELAKDD